MKKTPELHLIVLWANARYKESEILADVKQHVDIMAAYDVHWSCDCVSDNFSRFYGVNLPNNSEKEKECGTAGFLLLVVRDSNPKYEMTETSRGHELVNINIFALKQKYRSWTRGGHKIHTTNSVDETNHDSALLLGLNYDDLKKSVSKKWDGKIKTIQRDITGAHGWKDLNEFFYTLNATTNYVVLRGFEDFDKTLSSSDHGDIDIMVDDYENAVWIVGGVKHFPEHRPHYLISVGDKQVYIDLWDKKNNYHDARWDNDIITNCDLLDGVVRVPNTKNYFYMLIYHCLINKQVIAPDYYDKIYNLFVKLGFNKKYNIKKYTSPFDLYFQLLLNFMDANNYVFTKPNDHAVFFAKNLIQFPRYKKYLESKFAFTDVHTVYTDRLNRAYNMFLSGYDANGTRMFIKISDISSIYVNEYRKDKILYDMDNTLFIRPMYWRDCPDGHFVACEWTPGETLQTMLESGKLTDREKKVCLDDIYKIFKCLQNSDVVHRDITLKNLVWTDGHLKLIDFQLSVSKSHYKELDWLIQTGALKDLGTPNFRKQEYQWDDVYSLCQVVKHITQEKSYGAKYNKMYDEMQACIGNTVIVATPVIKPFSVKFGREINYKIFGLPIYRRHVSGNGYVKFDVFGIRIFKRKIKK